MKVLHVLTHLGRGGIERWLLSMLQQIPRTECAMDVCCKGPSLGPYASIAQGLGANVYHQPLRVTHVGFVTGLRRLASEGGYDIIHNHLQAYAGLPAFACRNLGRPILTSFHCTSFPAETPWLNKPLLRHMRDAYATLNVKYALRNSMMLTGCSQSVVDSIGHNYGRNGVGWRVLYYGTDLPPAPMEQDRCEFRRSFGWPADTPIVVHVGRFAKQKNHVGLLRIFEAVKRKVSNAKLLLIGGGSLRPAIEQMSRDLQLAEAVRFLGYRDDVPEILSRSDVFVFPSWFEGLGIAVLEASACGIPAVASRVPAIAEAIQDGVTGLLHNPHDTEAMAKAVTRLLMDREFASRLGAAGRRRVAEHFTNARSAESLVRIYHECLSKH